MRPEEQHGLRISDVRTPRDWRLDREKAAREVLVVQGDTSAFVRTEDGISARWSPGDFVRSLIATLLRADQTNRALIGIGFPAYAWAVDRWQDVDGVAALRERAGWSTGGLIPTIEED